MSMKIEKSRSDEVQAFADSILNGFQEPTMVADTDGRIININDQAAELYGVTESEALGSEPNSLQGDGTEAYDIVREALEKKEDIQQREEKIVAGKSDTPVERTATVLYDSDGDFSGVMLIEKDVTEKRRQRKKKQALDDTKAP